MGVEIKPFGVSCNLQCRYCYQNPMRDQKTTRPSYDLEKIKQAIQASGRDFTLFGGEPLLMPHEDLVDLLQWGYQKYGGSSIQTNGVLITSAHLDLFDQYNVEVGISLDGPGELNDLRWHRNRTQTRNSTQAVEHVIQQLCQRGRPPGLIVTLHRLNAVSEQLPCMNAWFQSLDKLGIRAARLHLLEVENESIRRQYALSQQENVTVLLNFAQLETQLTQLRFDVFSEMKRLLMGRDEQSSCVWNACDPYNTAAVYGIEGNGQSSNCGRTNKQGIDYLKAEDNGYERYLMLYHTPQEHGGCQGCRFFLMCKGQCPGTAIDGDWRNRTEYCGVWKQLFEELEQQLVKEGQTPLTQLPLRPLIEQQMVQAWKQQRTESIHRLLAWLTQEDQPTLPDPALYKNVGLPQVCRMSFVDRAMQSTWEPRLQSIRRALTLSSMALVGIWSSAVFTWVHAHDYFELYQRCAEQDLYLQEYPNLSPWIQTAAPKHHLGVIADSETHAALAGAIRNASSHAIHFLLNSTEPSSTATESVLTEPEHWYFNEAFSPLGASLFPRGLTIESEARKPYAELRIEALIQSGFEVEKIWLETLLTSSLQFSALHGIAEVHTPFFKCSYPTMYTKVKHQWGHVSV